jgi:ATP-binding cassette subfamily C protein CydD
VASSAAAAAWLGVALALSAVVARVFVDGESGAMIRGQISLMVALLAARAAMLWLGDDLSQRASSSLVVEVRGTVGGKLLALGPTFVHGQRAGELVRMIGEGAEALGAFVARYRPARSLATIVPVMVAAAVLILDPWSVLVLLFTGPLLVVLVSLIGRRVNDASARREDELAWMSAHFLDVLRGLPTLKMFGRSSEQAEIVEEVGRRLSRSTMDVLRTAFQTSLVLEWGAAAATALVAVEVSVRLMNGDVTFERALAVLLLTPEFFSPLRRLSAEYHAGSAGLAAAARIFELLDRPDRVEVSVASSPVAPVPGRPTIRFEDVVVSYDDVRRALDGLTLDIPEGRCVALMGSTGAGKTTVANLLLRFADPDSGSITVSGVPLDSLDVTAWRSRIGLVPQHPTVVHGTVEENLRIARPDASREALEGAVRSARADGFVHRLPGGFDTVVGEGGIGLSGGERQRLAIARAILRDPDVLVLDEATSHLDIETVSALVDSLEPVVRTRTTLVITHQPEMAALADTIAVIEAGRVAAIGSPSELRAEGALAHVAPGVREGSP